MLFWYYIIEVREMDIKRIQLEYAAKSDWSSNMIDGLHHIKMLPYISIVQGVEGNYDIQLNDGEIYNTGKGGFFVAPSNVKQSIIHHADKISGNMYCRWVFLLVKTDDTSFFDDFYKLPGIIPDEYKNAMNGIFDRLFSADNIFDEIICYHEIIKQLSLFSKKGTDVPVKRFNKTIHYIKNNYSSKISVEELATAENLSVTHFIASFKKETGMAPISFLIYFRLSMATEMLLNTKKTIGQIAYDVGINDPFYFNKLFKKVYKLSPSEFRTICRKID